MSLPIMHDTGLSGLSVLTDESIFLPALAKALEQAGTVAGRLKSMRIVRIRYRPGERAVLNVELGFEIPLARTLPASIWLHAGTKARKRARESAKESASNAPIHEPLSGALVYLFPSDPHVWELGKFLSNPKTHAGHLLPGIPAPDSMPELVRFRPGLGATLRWATDDDGAVYVKIQKDGDAALAVETLHKLQNAATGKSFAVPGLAGHDASIKAYAMREVRGRVYGDILAQAPVQEVEEFTKSLVIAMAEFRCCGVRPEQKKDRAHFVRRARSAAGLVAWLSPELGTEAQMLAATVARAPANLDAAPAHCDIKLDHIVFSNGKMVLLDLDSFTLADPLYDLAMLDIRVALLAEANGCGVEAAQVVCGVIRQDVTQRAGLNGHTRFGWLKACAALELAKHHSQNPGPDSPRLVTAALALGERGLAFHGSAMPGVTIAPQCTQTARKEIPSCA